jgi:benzodiazapine receptor
MQWYESLEKPVWTPEPETIGVIWQVLYPIILISFSYVFLKAVRGTIPWVVALPFAVNLVANLAFTPILFGLRSLVLASFDIVVVLTTIVLGMGMIWRYHRWVAVVQVPYLIWVAIATCLQLAITQMNVVSL